MTHSPDDARCARCDRILRDGFRLDVDGSRLVCLRCALRHRALVLRSLRVAVVVGTGLTAINQGDALLDGAWTSALAWKIPLTYAVPFAVAMWGALSSVRQRSR